MSSETKIGLLSGVAIILLIAIIISDQLSVANNQDAPILTTFAPDSQQSQYHDVAPVNPHNQDRSPVQPQLRQDVPDTGSDQVLLPPQAYRDGEGLPRRDSTLPPPINRSERENLHNDVGESGQQNDASQDTPSRNPFVQLMEDLTRNSAGLDQTPPSREPQPVYHYVTADENLWKIAERYYGNGKFWPLIARANASDVDTNGGVRKGARLKIPNKKTVNSVQPAQPGTQPVSDVTRVYVVQRGDTLWSIAQRKLGDGSLFKKILDMNRTALGNNARAVREGMKLRLPKRI